MKKISVKNKKISKKTIHCWTHYFHDKSDKKGKMNNEPTPSGVYCWIFPRNMSDNFIKQYCAMSHEINGVPTVNEAGDYFSSSISISREGSRAIAEIIWGYDF